MSDYRGAVFSFRRLAPLPRSAGSSDEPGLATLSEAVRPEVRPHDWRQKGHDRSAQSAGPWFHANDWCATASRPALTIADETQTEPWP